MADKNGTGLKFSTIVVNVKSPKTYYFWALLKFMGKSKIAKKGGDKKKHNNLIQKKKNKKRQAEEKRAARIKEIDRLVKEKKSETSN